MGGGGSNRDAGAAPDPIPDWAADGYHYGSLVIMRLSSRTMCAGLALAALAGCGDAPTTDSRQWYTKAPLEDPGLTITAEEPSEMAELGAPNLLASPAPEDDAEPGDGSGDGNATVETGAGAGDTAAGGGRATGEGGG